jgi:hypothetical protein
MPPGQRKICPSLRANFVSWNEIPMVRVSRHDGEKNTGLTGGVVMTDVLTVDWELLANLKPRSELKSISSSLLLVSEVSYPHPWREFKLLKREEVYNFDKIRFKTRFLEKKITS